MKYISNYFRKMPLFLILVFNALLGFLFSGPTLVAIIYYGGNSFFGVPHYPTFQEKLTGLLIEFIIILICVFLNFVFYKLIKKTKIIHENISRKNIVILLKVFSTIIVFLYFNFSSITLPTLFSFWDFF